MAEETSTRLKYLELPFHSLPRAHFYIRALVDDRLLAAGARRGCAELLGLQPQWWREREHVDKVQDYWLLCDGLLPTRFSATVGPPVEVVDPGGV